MNLKKIGIIALVLAMLMGCSSKPKVEDISVAEMQEKFTQSELLGMAMADNLEYMDPSLEIKEEELSEYMILMGMMIQATRIVVFEVKDEANIEKYIGVANALRQQVINSFEQYLPEPYEVAKASRVEVRGNYVIFIAHHEADAMWDIVNEFIPADVAEDVTAK